MLISCMDKKQVLLVDMEDTLYVSWVTIAWGEYMKIENPVEQRNGRPIHELFPKKEELDKFLAYIASKPSVYDGVPLLDGAQDVMRELNDKYLLCICTDFIFDGYEGAVTADEIISQKVKLLQRDFPFIQPSQYIFMKYKYLMHADILIDDKEKYFGPYTKQKLLFTTKRNQKMSADELEKIGAVRVNSWKEVAELLLKHE